MTGHRRHARGDPPGDPADTTPRTCWATPRTRQADASGRLVVRAGAEGRRARGPGRSTVAEDLRVRRLPACRATRAWRSRSTRGWWWRRRLAASTTAGSPRWARAERSSCAAGGVERRGVLTRRPVHTHCTSARRSRWGRRTGSSARPRLGLGVWWADDGGPRGRDARELAIDVLDDEHESAGPARRDRRRRRVERLRPVRRKITFIPATRMLAATRSRRSPWPR